MNKIDLTYSGKLKGLINILENKNFDINYTIEGKTGKTTTTSILINDNPLLMITFDYQELKKIIEGDKINETIDKVKELEKRYEKQDK